MRLILAVPVAAIASSVRVWLLGKRGSAARPQRYPVTKAEFLVYLMLYHRIGVDSRFHGDFLLLEILTSPPLGYSLYDREIS